jgi:hypothetical protein
VLEMFPVALSNLDKREVALARSMKRALRELERLQTKRAVEYFPHTLGLDENVNAADVQVVEDERLADRTSEDPNEGNRR